MATDVKYNLCESVWLYLQIDPSICTSVGLSVTVYFQQFLFP